MRLLRRTAILCACLSAGCPTPDPVSLEGKACPCAPGWYCDTDRNECRRSPIVASDASTADGAMDSALDAGGAVDGAAADAALADAGFDDAGPVGGGTLDGGAPDGGAADGGPPLEDPLWLEAEDGTLRAPMRSYEDATASGGAFIASAEGTTDSKDTPPGDGFARFDFAVAAGTYRVWGRTRALDGNGDSFWVRMDDGDWIRWNGIPTDPDWRWNDVHDADRAGNPTVDFDLSAGSHTLRIAYREWPTELDRLVIASDPGFTPSD